MKKVDLPEAYLPNEAFYHMNASTGYCTQLKNDGWINVPQTLTFGLRDSEDDHMMIFKEVKKITVDSKLQLTDED